MSDQCKHKWHALASECAECGMPIESYIKSLEAENKKLVAKTDIDRITMKNFLEQIKSLADKI